MASPLIGKDCAQIIGNTGLTVCPYDPANIEGVVLLPRGTVILASAITTFVTTLQAGIANNTETKRWFPIGRFEDMEDKSEEATITTSGFGVKQFVKQGRYAFKFVYTNGAMDLHSQLSRLNGCQDRYDILLVDKVNNCFWGTTSGTADVKGFRMDMFNANNIKFNTGAAGTKYSFEVGLEDERELNMYSRIISLPSNQRVLDYVGLIPTEVVITTQLVASTKIVVVKVMSGSVNLGDYYPTELATLAIWNFTRDSTGVTNAASAVSYSTVTKAFTITGTTAASYFNAGESYTLKLGTVTALASAGVTGYANSEAQTTAT